MRPTLTLRVRFAETDQMGIAHHSAYVVWFEAARVEWLRARGMSYRALEEEGVSLAVSALNVLYHQSTRFDDELSVQAEMTELKSRRVRYRYEITRGGERVASGESVHTPVDRRGRVVRLPQAWLQALEKHVAPL
ncbi:acyl-CoA thioesterase [Truepera radiovictrix]|uniref:Thioesterase superfamily protein n=1 Tax=Truepera radiovictrix (strain DSM 17093 / CIP 108686 / LMG 22925 / RQ-24) TaxID=649638 RepID=D7CWZ6_TRURR|nr:thioesterase family protein [Truepera radiovictrix]ADI14504.1 thioesterase superfamily protein [Truepera radiovictrix DSM 17093]WMT56943.1 thioesterase family protein [Truepera radiovictrix]